MFVVEDFGEWNSEMCWLAKRTTNEDRKEKEKKKFGTNERWKETQIDGKQHTKESRSNINIVLLPLVYTLLSFGVGKIDPAVLSSATSNLFVGGGAQAKIRSARLKGGLRVTALYSSILKLIFFHPSHSKIKTVLDLREINNEIL